jgi:multiple antibiotic resistance protein
MTETLVATFVTLFVAIEPLSTAAVFASLVADAAPSERRRTAVRGVVISAVVLFAFAFGGKPLLGALGIELSAFRIAGGILLLLVSIDMVMARPSGLRAATPGELEESGTRQDISVFPLAIPLIAGPGALTAIVLLMSDGAGNIALQVAIVAVLLAILVVTLLCLLAAAQIVRLLGETGVNVVSRVSGIILAALAVQFVIDGVRQVFNLG